MFYKDIQCSCGFVFSIIVVQYVFFFASNSLMAKFTHLKDIEVKKPKFELILTFLPLSTELYLHHYFTS